MEKFEIVPCCFEKIDRYILIFTLGKYFEIVPGAVLRKLRDVLLARGLSITGIQSETARGLQKVGKLNLNKV